MEQTEKLFQKEGLSMKVLDLFSGLGGWSAAFMDRGHDYVMKAEQIRFIRGRLKFVRSSERELFRIRSIPKLHCNIQGQHSQV